MSERLGTEQSGAGPGGTTSSPAGGVGEHMSNLGLRLAVAWTVVGIPLAYGVFMTVRRASQLFTG